MKILLLDIETAPNLAYVWGLWKENISIDKIVNSGYVLCFTAQWYGSSETIFASKQKDGMLHMLQKAHRLLDQADVVVHYNGKAFDIPTLNAQFVKHHLPKPAPYKQIDLLIDVVRSEFRFPSTKMDYVCQTLGIKGKVRHPGFTMWIGCMSNLSGSWRKMEQYNRHDVVMLRRLYVRLLPWIRSHPSYGAFLDKRCCPNCGSEHVERRGIAVTAVMRYQRYQCQKCGSWFRGNHTITRTQDRLLPIAR